MRTSLLTLSSIFLVLLAVAGYGWPLPRSTALAATQPAVGCSTAINFDDTLLCSFSTPGEVNGFSFTAAPNDRVIVRMERRGTGVNPHIQVLGSGGTKVCEAYGYSAAIEITSCLLTSGGSYTIATSNYAISTTGS